MQSHLCLRTSTPRNNPEEHAGSKDLGMQELKKTSAGCNRAGPQEGQQLHLLVRGCCGPAFSITSPCKQIPLASLESITPGMLSLQFTLRCCREHPCPTSPSRGWQAGGTRRPHSSGLCWEQGSGAVGRRAACLPVHLHTPQQGSSRISRPLKGCLFILGGRRRQLHCFAAKLGL